jgi:hypothetical protein
MGRLGFCAVEMGSGGREGEVDVNRRKQLMTSASDQMHLEKWVQLVCSVHLQTRSFLRRDPSPVAHSKLMSTNQFVQYFGFRIDSINE